MFFYIFSLAIKRSVFFFFAMIVHGLQKRITRVSRYRKVNPLMAGGTVRDYPNYQALKSTRAVGWGGRRCVGLVCRFHLACVLSSLFLFSVDFVMGRFLSRFYSEFMCPLLWGGNVSMFVPIFWCRALRGFLPGFVPGFCALALSQLLHEKLISRVVLRGTIINRTK